MTRPSTALGWARHAIGLAVAAGMFWWMNESGVGASAAPDRLVWLVWIAAMFAGSTLWCGWRQRGRKALCAELSARITEMQIAGAAVSAVLALAVVPAVVLTALSQNRGDSLTQMTRLLSSGLMAYCMSWMFSVGAWAKAESRRDSAEALKRSQAEYEAFLQRERRRQQAPS